MQAISTIRCPSFGSRPVVSVSRTISRINPPALLPVHTPPLPGYRQLFGAQKSDNCTQSAQAHHSAQTCRNNKVRSSAFFAIRHLIFQDCCQTILRHTRPPQYPLPLHEARCGDHENIITSAFAPALEEKRNIKHDNRLSPRAGLGAKLPFAYLDHRVNDPLKARKRPGITKHTLPEKGPINPAVCRANTGKYGRYPFHRAAT